MPNENNVSNGTEREHTESSNQKALTETIERIHTPMDDIDDCFSYYVQNVDNRAFIRRTEWEKKHNT